MKMMNRQWSVVDSLIVHPQGSVRSYPVPLKGAIRSARVAKPVEKAVLSATTGLGFVVLLPKQMADTKANCLGMVGSSKRCCPEVMDSAFSASCGNCGEL